MWISRILMLVFNDSGCFALKDPFLIPYHWYMFWKIVIKGNIQ